MSHSKGWGVRVSVTDHYMGWGCLGDRSLLQKFFARPAVNIRLTEYFIAIPFSWYILTEFEWKRNADSTLHQ